MNKIEQMHLDAIDTNMWVEGGEYEYAEKAASKSADITEQVAIEFGNFLFSKGIEYYDDLTNGVNYTIENKEGIFTMKELFQEFLKTKQ
jgi:hypothetical protein